MKKDDAGDINTAGDPSMKCSNCGQHTVVEGECGLCSVLAMQTARAERIILSIKHQAEALYARR